jgi:hypothetical protein
MSKHELNRIASAIIEEVEDYQATLEEKRFAPFIGKRVSFKLYDHSTPGGKSIEGTISQIWIGEDEGGSSDALRVEVEYRSPNNGHMTHEYRRVDNVTFLE